MLNKLPKINLLIELHSDIDQRVDAIREDHPNWLCRSGCEGCCHRLAEIPQLTAAEWSLLREGLSQLPAALQISICWRRAKIDQPYRLKFDQGAEPVFGVTGCG